MEESNYTKTIYDLFKNEFPDGWIDELSWNGTNEDKLSFAKGKIKIETFLNQLLVEYGKLVLSGDQFKSETKLLGKISNNLMSEVFLSEENEFKSMLVKQFTSLQYSVKEAENIVKYNISLTKDKFEHSKNDYYFNAIRYVGSNDSRIKLLNLMAELGLT